MSRAILAWADRLRAHWIRARIALLRWDGQVMTCPRRAEALSGEKDQDVWYRKPNGDRCCSYCGSLHPDDFRRLVFDAAEAASEVSIEPVWTKHYKVYVWQRGVSNASEGGIKFYKAHLECDWTDEDQEVYRLAIRRSRKRAEADAARIIAEAQAAGEI